MIAKDRLLLVSGVTFNAAVMGMACERGLWVLMVLVAVAVLICGWTLIRGDWQ